MVNRVKLVVVYMGTVVFPTGQSVYLEVKHFCSCIKCLFVSVYYSLSGEEMRMATSADCWRVSRTLIHFHPNIFIDAVHYTHVSTHAMYCCYC